MTTRMVNSLSPLQKEVYYECCDDSLAGSDKQALIDDCAKLNAIEARQTLAAWRGAE